MTALAWFRLLALSACLTLLSAHVAVSASPIRQLTNSPGTNLRPAWSPDGARIAFQSNRSGPYHVYVINADGTGERSLSQGDTDDRHPSWSPDGRLIAVDSGTSARREIWVIDVATGARTQVTNLGAVASFPSWSSDGRRLSFYLYENGTTDIWRIDLDGSNLTRLTSNLASESNGQCTFACHAPSWSPDGDRIAFVDGDQARVLVARSGDGGDLIQVSPDGERSHFPTYLRDGRIVYVTEHISQDVSWTDFWAVVPGTDEPPSELATGVLIQGPFAISPDGQQLLFASPRDGNFEIYAVTLDEEGRAALATRPARASSVLETGAQEPGVEQPVVRPSLGSPPPELSVFGVRLPGTPTPYLLALGGLALVTLAVEVTRWTRRRRRRS